MEAKLKNIPRRFVVNAKGYLLDEQQPGVIDDDAVIYTADAGARTFNFSTRTVLRHLFVGRWDDFASLPAKERDELNDVAGGALGFLRRLEQRHHHLSNVDEQHRAVLQAYIAGQARAGTVLKESETQSRPGSAESAAVEAKPPHVRNCDFTQYHPLRFSSDWLWQGGIAKRVEPKYPAEAKRDRLHGGISVGVLINGDGNVEQACAVGHPILRDAAESAALQWVFRPPKLNGEKIPYIQETLQFNFVLDKSPHVLANQ